VIGDSLDKVYLHRTIFRLNDRRFALQRNRNFMAVAPSTQEAAYDTYDTYVFAMPSPGGNHCL
jgi:hypothetical protein